jgi:hypothetical protein
MTEETDDLDKRLSVHEAVCAERYAALMARMGRLEKIILSVAGTLIVGMGGLLVKLLALVAKVGPA